jgi:hypothetical protein
MAPGAAVILERVAEEARTLFAAALGHSHRAEVEIHIA